MSKVVNSVREKALKTPEGLILWLFRIKITKYPKM